MKGIYDFTSPCWSVWHNFLSHFYQMPYWSNYKKIAAFSAANSNLDHIAAVLPFLFVLGSKTSPVINTFPLFYLM